MKPLFDYFFLMLTTGYNNYRHNVYTWVFFSIDSIAKFSLVKLLITSMFQLVLENFFHLMQLLQALLSKPSKQMSQMQIAPRANGGLIK